MTWWAVQGRLPCFKSLIHQPFAVGRETRCLPFMSHFALKPYEGNIVCPATHDYCQCLYMPPGATHFRSRRGFRVRLLYSSQRCDRRSRLMETGRKLARRVLERGPRTWRDEHRDWDFPPKPPWMRWKTYNRFFERWERYEQRADAALAPFLLKFFK